MSVLGCVLSQDGQKLLSSPVATVASTQPEIWTSRTAA